MSQNPITVKTSPADKVLQLTTELVDTKRQKKDSVKGFNEEIKRIQAEIEEILADEGLSKTEKTND